MRKIFLFMMISLDGFYEGVDHDLSWHTVDEEFNEFAIKQTGEVGMLLFGRRTYEMMASYWPTEGAKTDDQEVAHLMNTLPKMVFSTTLEKAEWENTTLVKEHVGQEVAKLKGQPGKDIAIFGSSDLCVSLITLGLLDELRIMVAPVVLGKGKSLFEGLDEKVSLTLTKSRNFKNGNVLLTYDVGKK